MDTGFYAKAEKLKNRAARSLGGLAAFGREKGVVTQFHIRPIRRGDGEGINTLRRMPGVFENILGIPSEQIHRNEEYIARMDGNSHQFVAVAFEDGGELIVGSIGLEVFSNPRLRHAGGVGLMVHKKYQGQGIGSALMETALDVADNWLMLVRIELGVFQDNVRAIHLYQKYGFEIEGTKRMAAIRGGAYADELMMARIHPQYR